MIVDISPAEISLVGEVPSVLSYFLRLCNWKTLKFVTPLIEKAIQEDGDRSWGKEGLRKKGWASKSFERMWSRRMCARVVERASSPALSQEF